MTFAYYTLLTFLIFIALLLILLILIQKGRGGGLSGAFGGSGGGSTAFGAKTGDVLTWATSTVFGLFIVLAVLLDLVVNSQYKSAATPVTGAAGSTPVMPVSSNTPPAPDMTPPPAAPTPVTTAPLIDLKNDVKNAATQAVHAVKTTTQP